MPCPLEPARALGLIGTRGDNYVELTVRFIVRSHGTREVKDAMSRHILSAFNAAGIEVASGTYDIVGFPPIRIEGHLTTDNSQARNLLPRQAG